MPLLRRIMRTLAAPIPKTWIAGGGNTDKGFFKERKRNTKQLERYRIIYDQGGIVTEAINAYPLFLCRNGYRLEGPDAEAQKVQECLDKMDFEGSIWDAVTDALVFGDAFQEIIRNVDGTLASIVPRIASEFTIQYDNHGHIASYTQKTTGGGGHEKTATLKPDQILHLQFWRTAGSMYGHSLIHRAYDDIMRDTKIIESTAEAIKRHGYKKYHVRVGREGDTRDVDQDTLNTVSNKFRDLNEKNDFTTTRNIEINSLDEGGLQKVDSYNDISIMRLSSALGVPEEILGLRRGSTDATAVKRIDTFYGKVEALQVRIARCYNKNVIDRITSRPDMIKLIWNDVSSQETKIEAEWIATIMTASADPFAVLPRDWIRKKLEIQAAAGDE